MELHPATTAAQPHPVAALLILAIVAVILVLMLPGIRASNMRNNARLVPSVPPMLDVLKLFRGPKR